MEPVLISPASFKLFGFIPTVLFSFLLPVAGVALFTYIIARRLAPIVKANPDFRFDRPKERIFNVVKIWLAQYRHPRYMLAGVLHIIIFGGFLILSVRSSELVIQGISEGFIMPGLGGVLGDRIMRQPPCLLLVSLLQSDGGLSVRSGIIIPSPMAMTTPMKRFLF